MQTVALPTEDEVYRMTKLSRAGGLRKRDMCTMRFLILQNRVMRAGNNIGYWERENYLGLGLGASSLMENIRYSNTRELYVYLEENQTYS